MSTPQKPFSLSFDVRNLKLTPCGPAPNGGLILGGNPGPGPGPKQ